MVQVEISYGSKEDPKNACPFLESNPRLTVVLTLPHEPSQATSRVRSAGDSGSACLMAGTGGEFPTKGFPGMTQRNGRVGRGHVCYMLRFGPQFTG
ncbi:hypothetical protein RRG08_000826 [Elysia crispata]|uniref:Uncharacterized protein n=1 Tax=Elysia crispata TaxID=231223 RepID=A0AAE1CIL0_9GAST|nr:hypothetical protein RRG08_000826 [Elysia crispata]